LDDKKCRKLIRRKIFYKGREITPKFISKSVVGDYVVPETPCVIGANTNIREGQGKIYIGIITAFNLN